MGVDVITALYQSRRAGRGKGLLEERFGLKYHHESRELPMYSLVVAKGGPKLKESTAPIPPPPGAPAAPDGRATADGPGGPSGPGGPPRDRVGGPGMMRMSPGALEAQGGGMQFPKSFLQESGSGRIHPPLKFAVSYSGFASDIPEHRAFYVPKIKTPMLHVIGSLDTVVIEKRSLALVDACEEPRRVVYHPGGHFVPSSQKEYVSALVGFIRDVISGTLKKVKEEESVEDMDLPF